MPALVYDLMAHLSLPWFVAPKTEKSFASFPLPSEDRSTQPLLFPRQKKRGNRVLGAHRLRYVEPPLHLHAAIADAGAGGFKLAIADLPLKSNFFIPLYSKPQAPLHCTSTQQKRLLYYVPFALTVCIQGPSPQVARSPAAVKAKQGCSLQ